MIPENVPPASACHRCGDAPVFRGVSRVTRRNKPSLLPTIAGPGGDTSRTCVCCFDGWAEEPKVQRHGASTPHYCSGGRPRGIRLTGLLACSLQTSGLELSEMKFCWVSDHYSVLCAHAIATMFIQIPKVRQPHRVLLQPVLQVLERNTLCPATYEHQHQAKADDHYADFDSYCFWTCVAGRHL